MLAYNGLRINLVKNKKEMEKKYYTPKNEELTINFEYQYFRSNGAGDFWLDDKITFFSEIGCDFGVEEQLGEGKIRVKMLDSDDLKELGWTIEIEDDNMIKAMIDIPYEDEGVMLHGKWEISFGKDRYCFIYQNMWGKTSFFRGIIKNKSKLREIMELIGVSA